jgi:hypothetical protein
MSSPMGVMGDIGKWPLPRIADQFCLVAAFLPNSGELALPKRPQESTLFIGAVLCTVPGVPRSLHSASLV